MKKFFTNFIKEEEGQGMAEYALILGVLAVGVVVALIAFGDVLVDKFEEVKDKIANAGKETAE